MAVGCKQREYVWLHMFSSRNMFLEYVFVENKLTLKQGKTVIRSARLNNVPVNGLVSQEKASDLAKET